MFGIIINKQIDQDNTASHTIYKCNYLKLIDKWCVGFAKCAKIRRVFSFIRTDSSDNNLSKYSSDPRNNDGNTNATTYMVTPSSEKHTRCFLNQKKTH